MRGPDRMPIFAAMLRNDFSIYRNVLAAAAAGALLLGAACSKGADAASGPRIDIPAQKEAALSEQGARAIVSRHGEPIADEELQTYVAAVGKRVVDKSAAAKSGRTFQFHVVDDAKVANAYALPDGRVYVTSALLRRLGSEAQLAAVLAHQMGHVISQHGVARLVRDGFNPLSGDEKAGARLADVPNDEAAERDADGLALGFLAEAGYDGREMVYALRVLEDAPGARQADGFFGTHPSPDDRLDALRQRLLRQRGPAGEAGEDRFTANVLSKLATTGVGGSGPSEPEPARKPADG